MRLDRCREGDSQRLQGNSDDVDRGKTGGLRFSFSRDLLFLLLIIAVVAGAGVYICLNYSFSSKIEGGCFMTVWDRWDRGIDIPVSDCNALKRQCDFLDPRFPRCRNIYETECYDDFMDLECRWSRQELTCNCKIRYDGVE